MVRSHALAKLTAPKLYEALARPRSFALLDEALRRPIVWFCAPPGSGKSTLVASHVQAALAWPFSLRVRALGVLELARDGEVIRFTGKAQQRAIKEFSFDARF